MISCENKDHRTVKRCWYYWKTKFEISPAEQQQIFQSGIKRLYIRFFDVDFDHKKNFPVPVGTINFTNTVIDSLEAVPVVFITNRTFENTTFPKVDSLAILLCAKINSIWNTQFKNAPLEIQFDCDWTEKTKDSFFSFIKKTEFLFHDSVLITTTIRLHQVKYFERTGVPPVKKGMLMFYNMGKMNDIKTENSIYDPQTASRYLYNFSSYPLQLDIALPYFSQACVFENGRLINLINTISETDLKNENLKMKTNQNYIAVQRCFIKGIPVNKGSLIRLENITLDDCKKAAEQIEPLLKNKNPNIVIFDLKPGHNEKENFESVYSLFE